MTDTPQFPWMKWFPRDFMSSTRGWPLTARGVYRELIDCAWDMGSLPAEPKELAALIGATTDEWRVAWHYVETKFPLGDDGRRRNARLESHRQKALDEHQARQRGARNANAKRWGSGIAQRSVSDQSPISIRSVSGR
jgi:uncharacterized protein YdaU (DUF1376 family)